MVRRCLVTKNPCGTDTVMVGYSCPCAECRLWRVELTRPPSCGACWNCLNDPALGLANPTLSRMVLCAKCGNKRCPKATDHRHGCTGSNEPGQQGSNY